MNTVQELKIHNGIIRWEFDETGNCIKEEWPDDGIITRKFNSINQMVQSSHDGVVKTFTYKDNGDVNTIATDKI